MAVGDIVNAIGGPNTILDFQPAAGVEVMISLVVIDGFQAFFYDGAITSDSAIVAATNTTAGAHKMFINNTNYLRIPALGGTNRGAYCGIQIGA